MDKDILRDLYYGRLSPWEMTFRKSSEYAKALTEVVACGDRLRELLTEEERALVDKMESAQTIFWTKPSGNTSSSDFVLERK
jgi:hypothetical protein